MTRRGRAGERGQATVEWIGLVLGLALALGGALGVARGADFGGEAHGLGEALASRVTCAARGSCHVDHPVFSRVHTSTPALDAFGGRGIRPSAPWERAPRGLRGLGGTGAGVLRALGELGRHAWFGCLGYRRVRYDLAHPRSSREGTPSGETLDALNECLNPWEFLFP